MRIDGRRILYESTNHGWAVGWTFYQLLAQALAGANDVVYLDTPRSVARGGARFAGGRDERVGSPPLRRLVTAGIPFQRTDSLRRLAARATAAQVRAWSRRRDFAPDLVWCYVPNAAALLDAFPRAQSVYWTGDEVTLPGEEELLRRVDAVLCVSDPVYERHRDALGARAHRVPIAVDFERYHAARGTGGDELPDLRRPIAGFSGFVNRRVDVELVAELAAVWPGTVVVAGPADAPERRALAQANVVLLGPQPPDRVPRLIDAFDVALLPLRDSAFNRNSNPAKFYEYLALGKPVVATDVPTLRRFADIASIGARETFLERASGPVPGDPDARIAVARAHSFDALLARLRALPA